MSAKETAISLIKKHEGFRSKPYLCPAGKLTVGYGRNIEDNGITEGEAVFLLQGDLERTVEELENGLPLFKGLSEKRQAALIDMVFNLGFPRFRKFKKMLTALDAGDYTEAAKEMLDSRWARQVGQRAHTLAKMVEEG